MAPCKTHGSELSQLLSYASNHQKRRWKFVSLLPCSTRVEQQNPFLTLLCLQTKPLNTLKPAPLFRPKNHAPFEKGTNRQLPRVACNQMIEATIAPRNDATIFSQGSKRGAEIAKAPGHTTLAPRRGPLHRAIPPIQQAFAHACKMLQYLLVIWASNRPSQSLLQIVIWNLKPCSTGIETIAVPRQVIPIW